ncbi:hypothetical protein [Allorhizocola rhizosphaerae]|uniref:hypothetical protein n=1 Tax=Allorhizocola rhizosphaerae TaxID=1872709 RepID=UPI0013C304AD|nr:hypothetical protein [Allorhizocola rhizosphaerae]
MAHRRNRPEYSPAEVLNLVCQAPVLWPGRTVRLERDSLLDQCTRSTSAQVSVSELYHENSKLSRHQLAELAMTAVDSAALRAEFLVRRAAVARSTGGEIAQTAPWKVLLDGACAGGPDWLYAIELRLVVDRSMFAYEPITGALDLMKQLSGAQVEEFVRALALMDSPMAATGAVVLVVGCFPRHEILLGSRGYRRTMIEAGRVTGEIVRRAEKDGRKTFVRYEFSDRELDQLTEVDGIEQAVIVAIELG